MGTNGSGEKGRMPASPVCRWSTGLFFVSRPWGQLKFNSYCHPYTIFALALNVGFGFLWRDFYGAIHGALGGKKLVERITILSATGGFHFFNGYTRCVFLLLARRIAKLIQSVEVTLNVQVECSTRRMWRIGSKILWILLLFETIIAASHTWTFYVISGDDDGRNSIFFPHQSRPIWFFVIFFVLGTFPAAISIYFAFAFIFFITCAVIMVFEDYCRYVHSVGQPGVEWIPSTSSTSSNQRVPPPKIVKESGHTLVSLINSIGMDKSPSADSEGLASAKLRRDIVDQQDPDYLMKLTLLERLDGVTRIYDMYDCVIGPLLMGLLVRNVFVVINDATDLLIKYNLNSGWLNSQVFHSILHLVGDLAQFSLLELGSWTERRMNKWKMDLERMVILMPASLKKDHLSDVVDRVSKWKWQMSAWGFFYVNRQLMSGIVATMLSYIVILFQLFVSEL